MLFQPDVSRGESPNGSVTVCRVCGSANAPLLTEVAVAADQVAAYLNQNPGAFVGSCPSGPGGNGSESSGSAGPVSAVVTVCRVTGTADAPGLAQLELAVADLAAFVNRNPGSFIGTCPGNGGKVTRSDRHGRAKIEVRPKRPGKVLIRGTAGRVVKTIGATSPRRSGGDLTG